MVLMSRKIDYALVILSYLHQQPRGGCAREIAERFGLSRAFVANILKELCHKGFVTSQRGVKGGYFLQRASCDITLAELIDALDDSFRFAECCQPSPDAGCNVMHICPVKQTITEVHQRIRAVLQDLTLAELFRPPAPAEGLQVGLEALAGRPCASVLME